VTLEHPASPAELVRQYGDPVLRERARPIRRINASVRELAKRMADTMYAVNGVGLAAPQIGESRRLVVLDVGDGLITLINPKIINNEGSCIETEACLSIVGLCGEVERFERVLVRALDLEGKEITVEGEGYLARALQHELDHLDGVLYVDRAMSIAEAASGAGDGDEDDPVAGDPEPDQGQEGSPTCPR